MRQIAPMFIVLALLATPVFAQPATRPSDRGGALVDSMLERVRGAVEDLKLSDAQKTQVDAIVKDAQRALAELKREVAAQDFRQRAREVRQLMESVRGRLGDVLTPEQREELGRNLDRQNPRVRDRRDAPPRAGAAVPGDAPATGPAARGEPRRPLPPGEAMLERLRQNLQKLNLSEEQQASLKALGEELREKGEALRDEMAGDGEALRGKLRGLASETREKIMGILTPQQSDRLRELMGPPPGDRDPGDRPRPGTDSARPDARPKARPNAAPADRRGKRPAGGKEPDAMMGDDAMMQDGMTGAAGGRGAAREVRSDEPLGKGPAVGDPAPALDLPRLDGTRLRLDNLKGRIVVLVFGSYSSPSFRNRATALDQLRLETGTKAQFIVIYGREAHPAGEWEISRNKEQGVEVQQPRSDADRKTLAQRARESLKLTTPVALDTMDNAAAVAYGAGANSAYVIGRDGKIAARQSWFEPLALKRAIDKAAKGDKPVQIDKAADGKSAQTDNAAQGAAPPAEGEGPASR